MPEVQHDHYEVLQVRPDAEPDIIQAAYRRLAFKYHPDRNPGSANAAQMIKQINQAYQTLSDPQRRAEYDRQRGAARPSPQARAQTRPQPRSEPQSRTQPTAAPSSGVSLCQVSATCRNRAIGRCSSCRRPVCRAHSNNRAALGSAVDLECAACRSKRAAATGGSATARPRPQAAAPTIRTKTASAPPSGGGSGPFDFLRKLRTRAQPPSVPGVRARKASTAKAGGGALVKADPRAVRPASSQTRSGRTDLAPAQSQVPVQAPEGNQALELRPYDDPFLAALRSPRWWMTAAAVIFIGGSIAPVFKLGIWLGHMLSSQGH